jgi:DNA-binding transcriptional LysR family regulator
MMRETTAPKTAPSGEPRFFQWLPELRPEGESLAALSGQAINDTPTPMIRRAAKAWSTPVRDLSCEQVRLLTSQRMGLQWLAAPVAAFVRRYPRAEVTFYPGDFSIAALRTFGVLLVARFSQIDG